MRRLLLLVLVLAACDVPPDPLSDLPDPRAVYSLVSADGQPVGGPCGWISARWTFGRNATWVMRERYVVCNGRERMPSDGGWVGKYRWAGDTLAVLTWPAWGSSSHSFGGSMQVRGDTLVTRMIFARDELRWVKTGP